MNRTAQRYAKALLQMCSGLETKEVTKIINKFADMLIDKGLGALLPEIMQAVEETPEPGTIKVTLTTAEKAPESVTKEFQEKLAGKLDSKVQLETTEDPNILGGAVVRYDDILLDASVRYRLSLLRQTLAE